MTNKIKQALSILLIFQVLAAGGALYGQEAALGRELAAIREPSILLSLAWRYFDEKRLGDALIFAQKAWKENGNYLSEASYLMGLIYQAQDELKLAQRHFERALDEDVLDERRVQSMYALANVYLLQREYDLYLSVLKDIERKTYDDDSLATLNRQRGQARVILLREGLNRVIELYRWPHLNSLLAIEMLGLNAYHQDTDEDAAFALESFLYAVVAKAGVIIRRVQYYRPDYVFSTLEQLLTDASSYEEIRHYIVESEFFRSYYFLAAALYAYNNASQSKVLFNRIRLRSAAGVWAVRAEKQFWEPFIDPLSFHEVFSVPSGGSGRNILSR
jgi:tetratricopeptide (TPR) repeat protein